MQATVNVKLLSETLKRGATAIACDPSASASLQGYGRIVVQDQELSVQCVGPSLTMHAVIPLEGECEDGCVCVCLQALEKLLKFQPPGETATLRLVPQPKRADTSGSLNVRSGRTKVDIPSIHPSTFKAPEEPVGTVLFRVQHGALMAAVDRVSFAGELHHAEGVYSNVLIGDGDGKLKVCALSNLQAAVGYIEAEIESPEKAVLMPMAFVKVLRKCLSDGAIEVMRTERCVVMRQGRDFVSFKESCDPETGYPDTNRFAKMKCAAYLKVQTSAFQACMAAAKEVLPEEAMCSIREGELRIVARNGLTGIDYDGGIPYESEEAIDVDIPISPQLVMEFVSKAKSDALRIGLPALKPGHDHPSCIALNDLSGFLAVVKTLDLVVGAGRE